MESGAMNSPCSSGRAVLLNVLRQRAQRREDATILFVVGAELKPIALGDLQRELEGIDGVEAETGAEQRRLRIDVGRRDTFEIDRGDDELSELGFRGRLRGGHGESGNEGCARTVWGA